MSETSIDVHNADDAVLVQHAASGHGMAFAELVQRHYPRALRVAVGMLKNRADAEDVTQDAFAKVHRKLVDFKGDAQFSTWLYRIVVNTCIDAMRKQKRRRMADIEDESAREHLSGGNTLYPKLAADPESQTERKRTSAVLQKALGQLSEQHRGVLILREIEGMSYDEIAEVLNIKKGTVMSRLFHARKSMQEALMKLGISAPNNASNDAIKQEAGHVG